MSMHERIESKLRGSLAPAALDVIDESGMHNVPKGAETHFKVVVVSSAFEGLSRVARQRLVYDALAEELAAGVHALSVTSKTPAEWSASSDVAPSPACRGGSSGSKERG